MTEDTRVQVKADLSLEDRGTTLVKGRTQPVRLWRVHT
jgi:class 3 adenylate cyclase